MKRLTLFLLLFTLGWGGQALAQDFEDFFDPTDNAYVPDIRDSDFYEGMDFYQEGHDDDSESYFNRYREEYYDNDEYYDVEGFGTVDYFDDQHDEHSAEEGESGNRGYNNEYGVNDGVRRQSRMQRNRYDQRQRRMQRQRGWSQRVNQIISSWPDASRNAARSTLERYGRPDGVTGSMLVWEKVGPWKRIIAYAQPVRHNFPMPHQDVLEYFINYDVPVDMFDDLARFDGSLIVERTKGEMSARCDSEAANLVALNLANDILTGRRSVEEARREYAQLMMAYKQGQRPAYTQRLQFQVPAYNFVNHGQSLTRMQGQNQNQSQYRQDQSQYRQDQSRYRQDQSENRQRQSRMRNRQNQRQQDGQQY